MLSCNKTLEFCGNFKHSCKKCEECWTFYRNSIKVNVLFTRSTLGSSCIDAYVSRYLLGKQKNS